MWLQVQYGSTLFGDVVGNEFLGIIIALRAIKLEEVKTVRRGVSVFSWINLSFLSGRKDNLR